MKDSKGNDISIGNRVRFLWNFDNRIHTGEIKQINGDLVKLGIIDHSTRRTSNIIINPKLTKIFEKDFE